MQTRHTHRSGKGKPSKALQQVIIRIDQKKYREFRSRIAKHGLTVSSFMRQAVDTYLGL